MIQRPNITQIESAPSMKAGTLYCEAGSGNTYIYVQASEALTVGMPCMPVTNGLLLNSSLTTLSAVNGTTLTATGIFTAAALAGSTAAGVSNGHIVRFMLDANSTGYGQGGVITNRVSDDVVDVYVEAGSANTISPDGRFDAATTTNDFVALVTTRVQATDAATDHVICVAQGTVTDEYWFWGLYKGGGYGWLDASGSALDAADRILIPAAAGKMVGTTGTTAEDELASQFGRAFIDMAGTDDRVIYAQFNCEQQWTMGVPPPARNRRLPYPAWTHARFGA